MSFHIISRQGAAYPTGTWFQCTDEGCMRVEIAMAEGRVIVTKEIGMLIGKSAITPYVTSIGKKGVLRHGEQVTPAK